MKCTAIGVRMHSGWGVLVAVSGDASAVEVVARRRIVTMDQAIPGARQPYHYAASLRLPEAEKYLANCAAVSEGLALTAVEDLVRELRGRGYRIVGSAVLLASGRALPSLSEILASHALIHTAEGEFFRNAVREACEHLEISVAGIRKSELNEHAKAVFGNVATQVQRRILSLGRSLGPPWTQDQKTAALAASILLARKESIVPSRTAPKSALSRKGVWATELSGKRHT